MKHELLFKVITDYHDEAKRHEYRIYASGLVEGFGEDVVIVNRYCSLSGLRVGKALREQKERLSQGEVT